MNILGICTLFVVLSLGDATSQPIITPTCILNIIEYARKNYLESMANYMEGLVYRELDVDDKCTMFMGDNDAFNELVPAGRADPFTLSFELGEKMVKNQIVVGQIRVKEGEKYTSINGHRFTYKNSTIKSKMDKKPIAVLDKNPEGFCATEGNLYLVSRFTGITKQDVEKVYKNEAPIMPYGNY